MPRGLQSFVQFRKTLAAGTIEPVYLFEGDEHQLHDEGIRIVERSVLPDGGGLDREVLRGDEISLQEVLDLASTYPMGGDRRLIIVRAAGKMRAESTAGLKDYLARPNLKTCLVLSDVNFDRRKSLYKELQKGAQGVDCGSLDEMRTSQWVRDRLAERGFRIGPELVEAIVIGLSGAGLGRLDAELEKLMSSIGSPREVLPGDLALLASVPRVGDAFLLARQILKGERGPAIRSVRALLAAGEEPVMLLGGLSWYVRNALRARAVHDRRVPPREMASRYGIDPRRAERFRSEVGTVRSGQLRGALRLCLAADRELKGRGARDPAHAFERLIHRIGRDVGRPV